MEKSQLVSLAFSAVVATTVCLASAAAPANAADEAAPIHYVGHAVILRNMIQFGKASPTVFNVTVQQETKTFILAWVLVSPQCAEISPGRWRIDTYPKHGTDTLAPNTWTQPSGQNCAGHTYTGAGIYYTSAGPASAAPRDLTVATWRATYGGTTYREYAEIKIRIIP
jgi:hypothetical protein